jgi:hypothetical protein
MAQQIVLHVQNAGDLLATAAYGAGAVARLHRDTTAAFAAPTSVTTVALVSGTDRYEVWDADGTASSWYRFRVENSGGTEVSDWSVPFQVLTQQPIATLAGVKLRLGAGATPVDDDALTPHIKAVNDAFIRHIGYYPGPSTDTTRTYHGRDAVRNGHRLWIPGGIRTLTGMTVGASTGATATAATSTDWSLGPTPTRSGEPYWYVEWVDVTTGNWSHYPFGFGNVVMTGLFGWASVPDELIEWAESQVVRRWKARATGDADVVGSDEFGQAIISYRLPAELRRVLDAYRMPEIV